MSLMTWKKKSSSGSGEYTTILADDGKLLCNCKGWTMRRNGKPRECTHVREVVADEKLRTEVRGEFVYALGRGQVAAPTPPASGVSVHRAGTATAPAAATAARAATVAPMLASAMVDRVTGRAFDAAYGRGWALEEKLDGHRVTAIVTDARQVAAFSRPRAGGDGAKSRELPAAIVKQLQTLAPGIYDGELVAPGGTSSDVVVLGASLVLVLFDVLELRGQRLIDLTYAQRRSRLLGELATLAPGQTCISTVESLPPTWARVEAIWAKGGEGAVVKRLASTYRPGWRSPDWIKVKASHSATLTVIGFDAGKSGPYSAFKLREESSGIETTVKVLGNALLRQVSSAPQTWVGKRVVITYQQRTASGTFRHPIFDHAAGVGE